MILDVHTVGGEGTRTNPGAVDWSNLTKTNWTINGLNAAGNQMNGTPTAADLANFEEMLAKTYGNEPNVAGVDIYNEPYWFGNSNGGPDQWVRVVNNATSHIWRVFQRGIRRVGVRVQWRTAVHGLRRTRRLSVYFSWLAAPYALRRDAPSLG
jgi:hypothetical protein